MRGSRFLFLFCWLAAGLAGCCCNEAPELDCQDARVEGGTFTAPSGVAVVGDLLFVANTNFTFEGNEVVYAPSEIVVIDLDTNEVVRRVPTSALNAQFLTVEVLDEVGLNAHVYAVSSGPSEFDGNRVLPTGPGAVDRLDVVDGTPPDVVALSIPIPADAPDPRVGFPTRLALSDDGAVGLAGSGTAGVVFRLDLVTGTLLKTMTVFPFMGDLNASAEARIEGGRTHILGFNDDSYCVGQATDGSLDDLTCSDIGDSPFLEGPIDLVTDDDRAFIVMSLANAVYEIALSGVAPERTAIYPLASDGRGCPCSAEPSVGFAPIRIVAGFDELYVVASGSNNIWALPIGAPNEGEVRAVLCPATNPVDLALHIDGTLFVSGQVSNTVLVLDGPTGGVEHVFQ